MGSQRANVFYQERMDRYSTGPIRLLTSLDLYGLALMACTVIQCETMGDNLLWSTLGKLCPHRCSMDPRTKFTCLLRDGNE